MRPDDFYLSRMIKMRIADATVIDDEFVDAVDVGNFKFGPVAAARLLHRQADKRVDPNEFHLNVVGGKWDPLATFQLFDFHCVNLKKNNKKIKNNNVSNYFAELFAVKLTMLRIIQYNIK